MESDHQRERLARLISGRDPELEAAGAPDVLVAAMDPRARVGRGRREREEHEQQRTDARDNAMTPIHVHLLATCFGVRTSSASADLVAQQGGEEMPFLQRAPSMRSASSA